MKLTPILLFLSACFLVGCGANEVSRLPLGKAELLFTQGISRDEASKALALLQREELLSHDTAATVQLRYVNRRYEFRCVVRAGNESNASFHSQYRALASLLSKEVFHSSPVDTHLCDEALRTLLVIEHRPLKPELPITVTTRRSVGGGSLVAQYKNNSDKFLAVVVKLRNPTLNQAKEVVLNLAPFQTVEHGWAEGWSYRSGETIDIDHADYEPLQLKIQ